MRLWLGWLVALFVGVCMLYSSILFQRSLEEDAEFINPIRSSTDPPFLLFIHPPQIDYLSAQLYQFGQYEARKLAFLRLLSPANKTAHVIVDVGANIGVFSMYAAALGFPQVIAIEPIQANFDLLQQSVAANRFANVQLHRVRVVGVTLQN